MVCRSAVAVVSLFASMSTGADDASIHLGVATCAGSNCHGASEAGSGANVEQNEFLTWHREDKHAKAYQILLEAPARRIAANLDLANAHEARTCLVCHTDFVPATQRGLRYQVSDGVGCEACHGGAEQWLGVHVSGQTTHARNIALGLYPTTDTESRATLCLGCHLGDAKHPMTHRLMGAGHPRLAFELDTFTEIQPAHFKRDADYAARKPVPTHAMVWATGQSATARRLLQSLRSGRHRGDGLYPEFIYFSCHGCHRPMLDPQYTRNSEYDGVAGQVRLADASLVMLDAIISVALPAESARYKNSVQELQRLVLTRDAELATVVDPMLAQLTELDGILASGLSSAQAGAIARRLIAIGAAGGYSDYARAEQSVMALDALRQVVASDAGEVGLRATVADLYTLLKDERSFSANRVTEALRAHRSATASSLSSDGLDGSDSPGRRGQQDLPANPPKE